LDALKEPSVNNQIKINNSSKKSRINWNKKLEEIYSPKQLSKLTKEEIKKLKRNEGRKIRRVAENKEQREQRLLKQSIYIKKYRERETEDKRKKRLQKQKETNKDYWKKRITKETKEQREKRLLNKRKRSKIYREKKKQIVVKNEIIQKFFNNYQSISSNQNQASNSLAQSPKFPSDHKKSGFCYCSVCNKPSSSNSR
jgi:hypothetical protein